MVAAAIAAGAAVLVFEARDDLQVALEASNGLHRFIELKIPPRALRHPAVSNDSVGNVDERHAERISRGAQAGAAREGGSGGFGQKGFKNGQPQ